MSVLQLSVESFVKLLQNYNIDTFHIVTDPATRTFVASHPMLQPIADYFSNEATDYDSHEAIFAQIGPISGVLQGAFVHRTIRGAGAGGVRNWIYATVEDWVRDGLRLSKGMTHKNALAGIWWGGGKGVMARNTGKGLNPEDAAEDRKVVYEEYGEFMSALRGCYVTAEDAGTSVKDMAAVFAKTRFTTCIPAELGGSGNPSVPTAKGVVCGLEAAFDHVGKEIKGSTIAVQGLGHVGLPLVKFLLERGVGKVIASDVDAKRVDMAKKEIQDARFYAHVSPLNDNSILFTECDAVSPCAVGGILNTETISKIRASIVCGAANNQLGHITQDDQLLSRNNIAYVPDFLVNRMGIVNCADEAYGYLEPDNIFERHLGRDWEGSIYNLTRKVLDTAAKTGRTSQSIALELAEAESRVPHPITGHRGIKIIQCLVNTPAWKARCYQNLVN